MKKLIIFVIITTYVCAIYASENQTASYPDPARWSREAEIFAQWDQKNSFPRDAVVFVGSSSIAFWSTARAFPDFPVINRGFGGSIMAESVHYADAFILKYSPKVVVVYAGDNDCVVGITPELIAADFKELADIIHEALPNTEILCLSVKLSESRKKYWTQMVQVNEYYREYAQTKEYITYVDTDIVLKKEDGSPDPSLYRADQLHLNEKGYSIWNHLLNPILKQRYALAVSKEEK